MRMESLKALEKKPKHFDELIDHYDLLVHGMSGKHKMFGGREAGVQIGYQMNLLEGINDLDDSDDQDPDEGKGMDGTEGGEDDPEQGGIPQGGL